MAEKRVQRRLAAILAADVVGFSRLMERDEVGTLAALNSRRQAVLSPVVAQHNGRVVKLMGDGVLVEFASAVDAVQCAVELQKGCNAANEGIPEALHIVLRIGINLGDVIVEGSDIFGDGVNIAARLEALAEPGGIYVSAIVHDQVTGKLPLAFGDLGERTLKNIVKPVRVYCVETDGADKSTARPKPLNLGIFALPEAPGHKPSIAVLPFINMNRDHQQEFIADGMTEDIITALSRIRELFVISRNSSFAYKGRAVRVEDVARELGVKFILVGSVRVANNRFRVTTQLVNGHSGGQVWAEHYDGELEDIFGVQDEITRNIALSIQVKLTYGELARLWEGQTKSLRAWEKMARGRDLFLCFDVINNWEAQRVLREALQIDPHYTGAMIQLGLCYWWQARYNASVDKESSLVLCEQQIERALIIDPNIGSAYMLRGGIAFLRDQHKEAIELCEKAIELAPSDSWAMAFLGLVCTYGGRSERAVEVLKTALRLSPHPPNWYIESFALANLWIGDLATAQEAAEENFRLEPDNEDAHMILATVYGFQRREDDAFRIVSELKKKFPAYSLRNIARSERYLEREKLDKVVAVLRRAGLPE